MKQANYDQISTRSKSKQLKRHITTIHPTSSNEYKNFGPLFARLVHLNMIVDTEASKHSETIYFAAQLIP